MNWEILRSLPMMLWPNQNSSLANFWGHDPPVEKRWTNCNLKPTKHILRIENFLLFGMKVHTQVKYTSASSVQCWSKELVNNWPPAAMISNNTVSSPFFWNSLCHCATFPRRGDDLDVIGRKLDQVSQRARVDDGRVSDEVLLKIHRLHGLCEGNLGGEAEQSSSANTNYLALLFPYGKTKFSSVSEPSWPILHFPVYIGARWNTIRKWITRSLVLFL